MELKFMALDKRSKILYKKSIGVFPVDCKYPLSIGSNGIMVHPQNPDWILYQFTGLRDKNGKEIYDGHILQIITPSDEWKSEVFWDNELAGFYINDGDSEFANWEQLGTWQSKCYEIIGHTTDKTETPVHNSKE